MKRMLCSAAVVTAIMLGAAPAAWASCVAGGQKNVRLPLRVLDRPSVAGSSAPAAAADNASIIGMWNVTLLVGNGPGVWDFGFEQWHADGTEIMLDVAVPPAAGNVCLGVWERVGPRGAKLHHLGFNWDTSVSPATLAGLFVLDMTVTLDRGGRTYAGRYVSDSYDNDGNIIPAFHAEGLVRARRIEVP